MAETSLVPILLGFRIQWDRQTVMTQSRAGMEELRGETQLGKWSQGRLPAGGDI